MKPPPPKVEMLRDSDLTAAEVQAMTPPRDQQSEKRRWFICSDGGEHIQPYNEGDGYCDHCVLVEEVTAHDEAREHLGNLLAIIHGDGGHYQAEHGNEKATTDAIAKYHELRTKHDEALPGEWETVDRDGVYGNVIDKTTGKRIFTYVDLRDCDRATAAHNSALRVLVDALRKAQRELIQVQPHIPQSC